MTGQSDADGADGEESTWRFAVDEVGEDAPDPETLEPGSPRFENAAFVLLGVVLSVGIFYAALGGL